MTTNNQARRLLHGTALSIALLLTAAPAALADAQGSRSLDLAPAATIANTPAPPAAQNAPKPDACYLSSARAVDGLDSTPRAARQER
jgi:hypothetical protein